MMALSPLAKLAVGADAGTAATLAHHKQHQQSPGHGSDSGSATLQQLQPQLSPAPCRKQQQQHPGDGCITTVSPHITRPHRGIPAVLRQQHPAAAHLLHQQHPAASWQQLLPPWQRHPCQHAQHTQQQQQHAIVRPRTSSCLRWHGMASGDASVSARPAVTQVGGVPRLLPPRPGSAAASRVLHALAKLQRQQQEQQQQQPPNSRSSSRAATAAARPGSSSTAHSLLLSCGSAFSSSRSGSSRGQGQTTHVHALPTPHPGDPAWQRLVEACAAGAISRPPTAAMHAVLAAAAAGPGDGVEARLDAIAASNRSCDDGAGLDIVARGSSSSSSKEEGGFSALLADDDDGGRAGEALQRQAAPMVLSLEQPSDSSLEVLQLELQALELCQLHQLEAALVAGPLFDRPS